MKIAVVTALWYEDKYLPALFSSLKQVAYPLVDWEIIMIDNKNSAVTKAWFATHVFPLVGKTLPTVTLLPTEKNLGFAAGNNACIRVAREHGCAAVFLLNEDAYGQPDFLKQAVRRLVDDANVAAVQSLIMIDPVKEGVNSIGNSLHFLGFSYCDGYRMPVADARGLLRVRYLHDRNLNIASASGAAVLLRVSALDKVGLLDETYYMYHEDVDLSLRLRAAGLAVVIEPSSVVSHKYEFSRSIEKIYWMERNRYLFLLEHFSLWTLIVLLPGLLVSELGLLVFAARGGSLGAKFRAYGYLLDPRHWSIISEKRRQIKSFKTVLDRELLASAVSSLEYQEATLPGMRLINGLMAAYWRVAKALL